MRHLVYGLGARSTRRSPRPAGRFEVRGDDEPIARWSDDFPVPEEAVALVSVAQASGVS